MENASNTVTGMVRCIYEMDTLYLYMLKLVKGHLMFDVFTNASV